MSNAALYWRSTSEAADNRSAVYIRCSGPEFSSLAHVVASACGEHPNLLFVVVHVIDVRDPDARQIEAALAMLQRAGSTRLCFAGTRAVLTAISESIGDDGRICLMLTDVGAHTPLTEILWDRLEAVQFDRGFVTKASGNLRDRAALASMLSLCRDIGLCTFGSEAAPGMARSASRTEFDYVLADPPDAQTAEKRPAAAVNRSFWR